MATAEGASAPHGDGETGVRLGGAEKLSLVVVVVVLAGWWNWRFVDYCDLPTVLSMNDVKSIVESYHATPNLLTDGLKWWHGEWIQTGIAAFRPLSSYLYWVECWIGLRWGFLWVGCLGFGLFVANCLLGAVLALRLTRSRICMLLAAVLGAHVRFHNPGQLDEWVAWFPVHQELLMNALLLGALVCFDVWLERAERRCLDWSWVLFVAGCLAKEHVYIFPTFAAAFALFRRGDRQVTRRAGLLQAGAMLVAAVALYAYRAAVIEAPRNPSLVPVQFVTKPLLFLFKVFGRYLLTNQYWLPGLSLLLAFILGAVRHVQLRRPSALLPYTAAAVAAIAVYLQLTQPPLPVTLTRLCSLRDSSLPLDLLRMLVTLYVLCLLWRYRREESTAAIFAVLCLAHLPIIDYIGWHYTLPPWFVWCPYCALAVKLIWMNVGRPRIILRRPPSLEWRGKRHTVGTPTCPGKSKTETQRA